MFKQFKIKDLSEMFPLYFVYMEASEPKWVNPDDIQYGINSFRLGVLQICWIYYSSFKPLQTIWNLINSSIDSTSSLKCWIDISNRIFDKEWRTTGKTDITDKINEAGVFTEKNHSSALMVLAVMLVCPAALDYSNIFKMASLKCIFLVKTKEVFTCYIFKWFSV